MTNQNKDIISLWKQNESKNGDAIIAVDENGYGHLIIKLNQKEITLPNENDPLPEAEYSDIVPGLYYADLKISEETKSYWSLNKPIYPIIMNSYTTLIINTYDFNHNIFSATTDNYEIVEFDPFVGCAIELSDEEYYNQSIAPTLIGHKFVVKSLSPLPGEIIFTTWKREIKS